MAELNIGIFLGHPLDNFPPQDRGRKNVGLVDRAELLAPFLGRLEADMSNPLNLGITVFHGVKAGPFGAFTLDPFRLGEVDAAGQFANDEYVKTAVDYFRLE